MGDVSCTLPCWRPNQADVLCRYRDVTWNEFTKGHTSASSTPARTGPRPDVTYAFPIIDTTTIQIAERRHDPQAKGFSLEVLGALRTNEQVKLRSTLTTPLQRYSATKRNHFGATDMMCFPWAVVETKKSKPGKSKEMKCYCQAANASAQALLMREELAQKAKERSNTLEACVIFAYTCIGPSIKLWMTYRDSVRSHVLSPLGPSANAITQDSGKVHMRCIWASSLELTWGVLQLRMIVENMREWVYSRVKGDIARYVLRIHESLSTPSLNEQRRRRHSSGAPVCRAPSTPLRNPPTRDPRTAPACVGRRSYGFPSTPSRRWGHGYAIDDFIDDFGVSDHDWDGDYEPSSSSEESSLDSDGDGDDLGSENDGEGGDDGEEVDDEDDEVKDLVKDMKRWYPDLGERPAMKALFDEHGGSDCSDDQEETSDEQSTDDEEHTDDDEHTGDEEQTDNDDEQYYIDGKRMSDIFSKARQRLGMDALRVAECSKSRRLSSRF